MLREHRSLEKPAVAENASASMFGAGRKLPLHGFDVPSWPTVSFAGTWRPAEGGAVFAFLTTVPNPMVVPNYPKAMPVLLHKEEEGRRDGGELEDLVAPFPAQVKTVRLSDV